MLTPPNPNLLRRKQISNSIFKNYSGIHWLHEMYPLEALDIISSTSVYADTMYNNNYNAIYHYYAYTYYYGTNMNQYYSYLYH